MSSEIINCPDFQGAFDPGIQFCSAADGSDREKAEDGGQEKNERLLTAFECEFRSFVLILNKLLVDLRAVGPLVGVAEG